MCKQTRGKDTINAIADAGGGGGGAGGADASTGGAGWSTLRYTSRSKCDCYVCTRPYDLFCNAAPIVAIKEGESRVGESREGESRVGFREAPRRSLRDSTSYVLMNSIHNVFALSKGFHAFILFTGHDLCILNLKGICEGSCHGHPFIRDALSALGKIVVFAGELELDALGGVMHWNNISGTYGSKEKDIDLYLRDAANPEVRRVFGKSFPLVGFSRDFASFPTLALKTT